LPNRGQINNYKPTTINFKQSVGKMVVSIFKAALKNELKNSG